MNQLRIDCTKLVDVDVPKCGRRLPAGGAPRRKGEDWEKKAMEALVGLSHSPTSKLLKDLLDVCRGAHRIPITLPPLTGPLVKLPTKLQYLTAAVGLSGSACAFIGATGGVGVYGSNLPEYGTYATLGAGFWTNMGISNSVVVTYIIGPPSSFGGLSWGVGIDADIPGVGLGLSGMAVFGISGPPFEFLGMACGVGVGISVLPVDVTIQVSQTTLNRTAGKGTP